MPKYPSYHQVKLPDFMQKPPAKQVDCDWRIRWRKLGGHIHLRVFGRTQGQQTFAKLGDLTVREEEFNSLVAATPGVEYLPEE